MLILTVKHFIVIFNGESNLNNKILSLYSLDMFLLVILDTTYFNIGSEYKKECKKLGHCRSKCLEANKI